MGARRPASEPGIPSSGCAAAAWGVPLTLLAGSQPAPPPAALGARRACFSLLPHPQSPVPRSKAHLAVSSSPPSKSSHLQSNQKQ